MGNLIYAVPAVGGGRLNVIRLTDYEDKTSILLNPDHIVSVRKDTEDMDITYVYMIDEEEIPVTESINTIEALLGNRRK